MIINIKKIINVGFIVELLLLCGLAIFIYREYNVSLGQPPWSFDLWLSIGLVSFVVVGGLLSYSTQVKDGRRAIFYLNIQTIIVSIYLIRWGVEVIRKKRLDTYFEGQDTVLYAKISVGVGILGIIWALFTKKPDKRPTSHSEFMICVNCLVPYAKQTLERSNCPKCGGMLENLSGFYDRHPDLSYEPNEKSDDLNAPQKKLIKGMEIKEIFRMLLLLIFLIMIVFYAFWQSFIVHGFK